MINYLYCYKKRNNPRVHHSVCEEKCNKIKKCVFYKEWHARVYGEPLKTEIIRPKTKTKRRPRKKKLKTIAAKV